MSKIKFTKICILTSLILLFMPASLNRNKITANEQEEVKETITKYLEAVINKNFETVYDLTESNLKKYDSLDNLKEKQMGIKSMEIRNFKPYHGLNLNDNTPTRLFKVELNITPNDYGSWNDGINPRFIWGVKESGVWKVSGFAESQSREIRDYQKEL
ncbi:hypothetical protein [Paenibacillus sp. V4I5]|uniref:hypothetical protein n=1 Tax=Paenibacillus sp. V4I5 TaxID=3042306 RepID=UPI00278FC684|nr:hypothetical protein [Paenibacillus sp. V4I5]MDQ0914604.1 hypothetical protein [Paenibacillus sp. V4I5]